MEPDNQVSANITTAKTIDELRHTVSSHVILSVEEAKQRLAAEKCSPLAAVRRDHTWKSAWPH